MKRLRTAWLSILTFFGIGTMLGKDKHFKLCKKTKVGPWYIVELSAWDRQSFIDLAQQIGANETLSPTEEAYTWMNMRMQAIAASVRNRFGYMIYDPLNGEHINELSRLPEHILKEALNAINEVSTMPWLVIPEAANDEETSDVSDENEEEERHVNP